MNPEPTNPEPAPPRRGRGPVIAVGVASAVVSMLGMALVALAIVLAMLTDAWIWAVLLGAAGSLLTACGIVAVVLGAVIGATARRRTPRDDAQEPPDPGPEG